MLTATQPVSAPEESKPTPAIAAEPALLGDAPPGKDELKPGTVWPAAEVRRMLDAAWAQARRTFEAALERKLAAQRAELEQEFEAKRAELVRDVAMTTRELLAQHGR